VVISSRRPVAGTRGKRRNLGGSNPVYPTAAGDNWTTATICAGDARQFSDDLTEPLSETAAYTMMNGVTPSTRKFIRPDLVTATVTLLTVPQTKAYYSADPGLLLNDARATAKKAGFVTANYDATS